MRKIPPKCVWGAAYAGLGCHIRVLGVHEKTAKVHKEYRIGVFGGAPIVEKVHFMQVSPRCTADPGVFGGSMGVFGRFGGLLCF